MPPDKSFTLPATFKIGRVAEFPNEVMERYPDIVEKHIEEMKKSLKKQFQSQIPDMYINHYKIEFVYKKEISITKERSTLTVILIAEVE